MLICPGHRARTRLRGPSTRLARSLRGRDRSPHCPQNSEQHASLLCHPGKPFEQVEASAAASKWYVREIGKERVERGRGT